MAGLTLQQLQAMGAQPISNTPKQASGGLTFEQLQAMGSQPETRDSRISQGLPVGRVEREIPTFGGQAVRGIIKPFVKLGSSIKAIGESVQGKEATGLTSKYLGNVRPIGEGFDVIKGFTPENVKAVKDSVGTGLDIASNIPIARGLGLAKTAIQQPFQRTAFQVAKNIGKEGVVQGGLSGAGTALQENKGLGGVIGDTLLGTALGGAGGFVLGGAGARASRAFTKTPAEFTSTIIDKDIRKAMRGVTGDVEKLDKIAYGSKKGLELLANESSNIKIPDSKAPLGSGAVKSFDIIVLVGNPHLV